MLLSTLNLSLPIYKLLVTQYYRSCSPIHSLFTMMVLLQNDAADVDFFTFEGIVTMFTDPNGIIVGWIHYCIYDALVGRWIAKDSVEQGATVVPVFDDWRNCVTKLMAR